MIKNNKWKIIISSAIILLPILAGLILWNSLPEQMATHWGADGEANGWSSRLFAVVGLPVFIFFVHWICLFATAADKKNKNQNKKIFGIIFWICPVISVFGSATIYAAAFGKDFSSDIIMLILIGLMFVILGNYLPKCKQNYTIGIKLPWTINNEENWNKTHRLAGKFWVVGGLLMMATAFLPHQLIPYILCVILIVVAVIPTVYSYLYHRKQHKK